MSGFQVIAHRGDSACHAENSREAIASALAKGAQWLEIDVRLSADGVPVLQHDATLRRCFGLPARVSSLRWPELEVLRYSQGERFLSLEQVLAMAHEGGAGVYVELKDKGSAFVHAVAAIVRASPCKTVVSSFDASVLKAFREDCPEHPTMALFERRWRLWGNRPQRMSVCEIGLSQKLASTPLLERLTGEGWPVFVFTVNDPEAMASLKTRGARGVFCDHAGRFPKV